MSTVDVVRRFNRLYTRTLGLLPEQHLHTPFTLVEARVLYELAHRDLPTASAIASDLQLDLGYMSRIVARLEKQGLLEREQSATDRRQMALRLTAKGRAAFKRLDQRASSDVRSFLERMPGDAQLRIAKAMSTIESILDDRATKHEVTLRAPRSGDLGWVVEKHGELYAREYAWNFEFEGLVAQIVADFAKDLDETRERAWIAELNGERVGCVFLVKKSAKVAKLRLLLVDPAARGLGIGRKLVDACTEFARAAGYKKIVLWTNSVLDAARHIYASAGYRVIETEPHHSFGHDLVSETWELEL